MCRLAAFPPNFSRTDAINIMLNFERCNKDGTGYTFIRNGEFVTYKWPKALTKVLKKTSFLSHMPHNGWTIAHLRAASHGYNCIENTHPFIVDNKWAVAHNGIWSEYNLVKLALSKQIEFDGDTDSEVAAHLLNITGPKKFTQAVDMSGVFLALNKNGSLWAIKTSGELTIEQLSNKKVLLASELNSESESREALIGWYYFDKDGKYVDHKEKEDIFKSSFRYKPGEWNTNHFPLSNRNNYSEYWKSYYAGVE